MRDSAAYPMTNTRSSATSILLCVRGPANDDGWNEAAYRAAAHVRLGGIHIDIVQALPSQIDGWTAVVGHGMDFERQIEQAALKHNDIRFLLTDDSGSERTSLPNLWYVDWRWDEGAFLAGLLASYLSESGIVAVLGGNPCCTQHRAVMGFVRGARHDRGTTTVLTAQTGSFDDADRGFRLANALFDEGVDVLLHTADACGRGAIRAAQGRDRRVVGFLNADDPTHGCVVGFVATDVERAMRSLLAEIVKGGSQSRIVRCGLASGHQRFELASSVSKATRLRIDEVAAMIVAGKVLIRPREVDP